MALSEEHVPAAPAATSSHRAQLEDAAGRRRTTVTVSVPSLQRPLCPGLMESVSRRLFPRLLTYSADYPEQYARIVSCKI